MSRHSKLLDRTITAYLRAVEDLRLASNPHAALMYGNRVTRLEGEIRKLEATIQ